MQYQWPNSWGKTRFGVTVGTGPEAVPMRPDRGAQGECDWPGFGRWVRESAGFKRGELGPALLSLLESSSKHGYQLKKELIERLGGCYRASGGAVYPRLRRLENEGLVSTESENGRLVYTLTDTGRSELNRERDRIDRIWIRAERRALSAPGCGAEGAMVAAAGGVLLKAALSAVKRSGGDPESATQICDILDRARREIEAMQPLS
jgi:DNA-binding PadR family transcriptional regulator